MLGALAIALIGAFPNIWVRARGPGAVGVGAGGDLALPKTRVWLAAGGGVPATGALPKIIVSLAPGTLGLPTECAIGWDLDDASC